MMLKKSLLFYIFLLTAFLFSSQLLAQGVTTSSMTGIVTDQNGEALPGATVIAVHTPSGTQYGTATLANGRFNIPSMRVGGPYTVTVSFVGYADQVIESINLSLGTAANLEVKLQEEGTQLSEVEVRGERNQIFSSERTGASTNIQRETINALPTLSRSINDFTRLTPQASGTSFAGQDNRFNNVTIDGSIFNNSFGLSGQPGGRTNVAPISLDAIEEIQVNLAPYDVRQSGFTGAGVNAITRSGTNEFSGSVFYNFQNQDFVGDEAAGRSVTVNNFKNEQIGFRLGGPILKNKLFFFVNGEFERRTEPGTTFRANRGGEPVGGNITRVLASDLDSLSNFLRDNFGYETGPYEGYDFNRKADRFLAKLDYNINQNHRASLRYTFLDSQDDVLLSNSPSLGFGNRRTNTNALNFANSNYIQLEKIHSIIGELNSNFGQGRFSNNLILGYTYQNEDRGAVGEFFPLVEILQENNNYTTFGFEPFTPSNQLSYHTYQLQDNFTYYAGAHTITAGFNVEHFRFRNVFFPGSQSVYVYNSLEDFYADANGYLENPNRTLTPITIGPDGEPDTLKLRRFQLRYSALPGGGEPVQPTRVTYAGVYLQDEWQVTNQIKLTGGLRIDVPFFEETGLENPEVSAAVFRDANGNPLRTSTSSLPDPRILWSPRLGFNWDVTGDRRTQVRGGTGIFTGRPAFVWISNQIGNNGVLTGFDQPEDNTPLRPFNPDPAAYIPSEINFPPAEIATTDENFKFPQVWRTNIAVDQQLPFGLAGTLEFIYNRQVNAINYLNINQVQPSETFAGPDQRPRFPGSQFRSRIDTNFVNNIYLTNTDEGYSYSITAQLERPFANGFFARVAYNFGVAKDIINPGSIATGSWTGNATVRGNNDPDLGFSANDQRHRVIGSFSYRKEYGGFGATQLSLFYEARNQGRFSYVYAADMNGDGVNFNDLIYVPNNASELTFLPIPVSNTDPTPLFTPEQQAAAFEAYINQDDYLNERRGDYAERNGALLPWVFRADLSLIQEFYVTIGNKRNTLQLRGDIFNIGNLLNSDWGVGDIVIQNAPLSAAGTNAQGVPQFRMATVGSGPNRQLLSNTFQTSANLNTDVWRAQIGVRYIFN